MVALTGPQTQALIGVQRAWPHFRDRFESMIRLTPRLLSTIACPVLVLLALPVMVKAQELQVCVDASGSPWSAGTCCGGGEALAESSPYPSIASALSGVAGQGQSSTRVCVQSGPLHEESVSLDFSSGAYGDLVEISFRSDAPVNWCPGPSGGFEFVGPGSGASEARLSGLRTDARVCSSPDSGVATAAGSSLVLDGVRVIGGTGVAVSNSSSFADCSTYITNTRVEARSGPVVNSSCSTWFDRSEVSASTVAGIPLVETTGGAQFWINRSAFASNVAAATPLIRVDGLFGLFDAVFADNVVLDERPLLHRVGAPSPDLYEVDRAVFSGNRLLEAGTASAPDVIDRTPGGGSFCLPDGADDVPFLGRPTPTSSAPPGNGALIEIDPDLNIALWKTTVAANELSSDGAFLRADGTENLAVIHNTFEVDTGWLFDLGGGAEFASTRNVYVGEVSVRTTGPWAAFALTLDEFEVRSPTWETGFAGGTRLDGPHPSLLEWPPFAPAVTTYDPSTECARVLNRCPGLDPVLCDDPNQLRGMDVTCGLHAAVNYRLTDTQTAQASPSWPWQTQLLPDFPSGALQNRPGAEGGVCGPLPWPSDALLPGGEPADQDGYSSLVDCENADEEVVPEVPENHGLDGGPCEPTTCWSCPGGDDDDDAGDDDDAADDDDASDDDEDPLEAPVGCTGRGCGVTLPTTAFLPLLLLLGLRSRR